MGKVISIGGQTDLPIPTDRVLEGAVGKLETVVVVCWEPGGKLYLAANTSDGAELLWLLERAKRDLINDSE